MPLDERQFSKAARPMQVVGHLRHRQARAWATLAYDWLGSSARSWRANTSKARVRPEATHSSRTRSTVRAPSARIVRRGRTHRDPRPAPQVRRQVALDARKVERGSGRRAAPLLRQVGLAVVLHEAVGTRAQERADAGLRRVELRDVALFERRRAERLHGIVGVGRRQLPAQTQVVIARPPVGLRERAERRASHLGVVARHAVEHREMGGGKRAHAPLGIRQTSHRRRRPRPVARLLTGRAGPRWDRRGRPASSVPRRPWPPPPTPPPPPPQTPRDRAD
jgi:hypothetical protein